MSIQVKRVTEIPRPEDGKRILVDRYWPRGLQQSSDTVSEWLRELAPSPECIAWYGHKADRWEGFKERYWAELDAPEKAADLEGIRAHAEQDCVTLLYRARHAERNAAVALLEYLSQSGPLTVQPAAPPMYRSPTTSTGNSWPRIPVRATFQWAGLGLSLFLPLSGLLVIQVGLTYGSRGWLMMSAVLLLFAASTLIRVQREERFRAELNDAIPRNSDERESLWTVLRAVCVSLVQTVIALAIIGVVFLILLGATSHLL